MACWCNLARNAAIEAWRAWAYQWAKENGKTWSGPGPWQKEHPGGKVSRKKRKTTDETTGEEKQESVVCGFGQYLNDSMRAVVPGLAPELVSSIANWIAGTKGPLKPKVPRTRRLAGSKSRYVWEAVLAHESALPSFTTSEEIPVPCCQSALAYAGCVNGKVPAKEYEYLEKHAKDAALLCCPLFAASYGRGFKYVLVQLEVGKLTCGNKEILRNIASGKWKLRDSKITRRKGSWELHLSYTQPAKRSDLDAGRVATLWPNWWECSRPFELTGPTDAKVWRVGNGQLLVAQRERLDTRRMVLCESYRTRDARRGHGQGRFFAVTRHLESKTGDLQKDFRRKVAAEVVRYCAANNCGTVVFRVPGMGLRKRDWFARQGVSFAWCDIERDLPRTLQKGGIACVLERVSSREWYTRYSKKESRRVLERTEGGGWRLVTLTELDD